MRGTVWFIENIKNEWIKKPIGNEADLESLGWTKDPNLAAKFVTKREADVFIWAWSTVNTDSSTMFSSEHIFVEPNSIGAAQNGDN